MKQKSLTGVLGALTGLSAISPTGERYRPLLPAIALLTMLATCVVFTLLLAPPFVCTSFRSLICEPPSASNSPWVLQQERNAIESMHPSQNCTLSSSPKNFSILMGVFSTAARIERRNLIRIAYGVQHVNYSVEVTIRFIVGRPRSQAERLQLGLESLLYRDIVVLDMEENMNGGKTWCYFSTIAAMGVRFDYVMKLDDDSYVRVANLAASLAEEARNDLYYGYPLPCSNKNPYNAYMAGMGYVITWDLVLWISESEIVRNQTGGYSEDRMTRDWFDKGGKAKNRVNKKPYFYDHPAYTGANRCTQQFNPETILIHQVKTTERWMDTLEYFEGNRSGRIIDQLLNNLGDSGGALASTG